MSEVGARARKGLSHPARIGVDAVGYGLGALLAGIAALRGGKAVHPHGVVYEARLVMDGRSEAPQGAELFSIAAERPAIVRFSRSVGLPRPIPDLLGVSLRVLDAYGPGSHQDVLAVTSVDRPLLHHLFVPATDVQQRVYSTSLPYRANDETFLIGVMPDPASPRPPGSDEFDRLAAAAATGKLVFGIAVAPIGGRFRRVGSLEIGEPLPQTLDALRFNPLEHCGGGLEPIGAMNRLRDYAYPLSQAAWGLRGEKRRAQRRADREQSRRGAPAGQ